MLLSGIPNEHEYYFSHTNITETEQSFQISCNIFIDDLEDMFKEEGIENLNLGLENESQITDSLLNDYLSKNLIFDDSDWSATRPITSPLSLFIFDSILECVGGLSPNKSLSISQSPE